MKLATTFFSDTGRMKTYLVCRICVFLFFFATSPRISPSSVSSLDAPSPFLTIFVFFVFCRIPNHDAPLWSLLTFVLHDSAVAPHLKLWCSNRPSSNVCCCSWLVFRFRVRSPLQRSTSCFTWVSGTDFFFSSIFFKACTVWPCTKLRTCFIPLHHVLHTYLSIYAHTRYWFFFCPDF